MLVAPCYTLPMDVRARHTLWVMTRCLVCRNLLATSRATFLAWLQTSAHGYPSGQTHPCLGWHNLLRIATPGVHSVCDRNVPLGSPAPTLQAVHESRPPSPCPTTARPSTILARVDTRLPCLVHIACKLVMIATQHLAICRQNLACLWFQPLLLVGWSLGSDANTCSNVSCAGTPYSLSSGEDKRLRKAWRAWRCRRLSESMH